MKEAIKVLNDLESAGIIDRYAIGGAVAAIFYAEAIATSTWTCLFYSQRIAVSLYR